MGTRPRHRPVRRWTWSAPGWGTWPPPTPPSSPPRPRPSACASSSGTTRWRRRRGPWFLAAFTAGAGPAGDGDYSAVSWLIHRTGITRGAAVGHSAWARRSGHPPRVLAALAAGKVSESVGRVICLWTDKLPQEHRDAADEQLLAAVRRRAGAGGPGGAVRGDVRAGPRGPARSGPGPGVRRPRAEAGHHLRRRRGGARGPDRRSAPRRWRRCWTRWPPRPGKRMTGPRASGTTTRWPRRCAGWPRPGCCRSGPGSRSRPGSHISLADLLRLQGSSALQEQWTGAGPGPVGRAPRVRLRDRRERRRLAGRRRRRGDRLRRGDGPHRDRRHQHGRPGGPGPAVRGTGRARRRRDRARGPDARPGRRWSRPVIGKAVDLLSGPGGLASFLRRRQLGVRLGGPSLPLDIGYAETIPAGIRNAVVLRDRHCQWAGGCNQPAGACEVHHTRHKANGGKTSVKDCVLLCPFHHQIVIHRWGWTLVLNPDGTTTAWNKDKTKVLHSHGPPSGRGDMPSTARDEHRMTPPGNRGPRRHPVLLVSRPGAGRASGRVRQRLVWSWPGPDRRIGSTGLLRRGPDAPPSGAGPQIGRALRINGFVTGRRPGTMPGWSCQRWVTSCAPARAVARAVHLVCDDVATCSRPRSIQACAGRMPGSACTSTPNGSSWINRGRTTGSAA